MAGYTRLNLKSDVEDMAPKFGLEGMQSRFARRSLQLEKSGLTLYRLEEGGSAPFGHRHREQEEIYVVVSGNARLKIEDEILDLGEWDAVRVPGECWRQMMGGEGGAEVLAFGAPVGEEDDSELKPGWWEG